MRKLSLAAIRLYQMAFSPYIPGMCRHTPTCSVYSYEAISRYGAFRGIWMGLKRLCRCRPMGSSGYDPVP